MKLFLVSNFYFSIVLLILSKNCECVKRTKSDNFKDGNHSIAKVFITGLNSPDSELLVPEHFGTLVQVFDNTTENEEFEKQVEFNDDDESRPYRKRYGGGNYGREYGGTWTGFGAYGAGAGSGHKGHKNHHYNPSVNKYGGGGPLNYNPGKKPKPNYGSSYVPSHILPGIGGGGVSSAGGGASVGGSGNPGKEVTAISEDALAIVICEVTEKCHAFTHCASHSNDYLTSKNRCCIQTRKQVKGMCCDANYPVISANTGRNFNPYPTDTIPVPDISQSSLQTAAAKGYDYQARYRTIENRLLELNIVVERGTSAHGHLQFFQVYIPNIVLKI
jgi:hypothetical protein